ncbi:MAG: hypothetical protein WBM70_01305 [Sulfurovum sp.]|jgi:hypothetical protein|uniref:hypothetical protein n=1 Tax=Sulfurovum sp. TaxID=1969726 RepID=UPI003C71BFF0
MSKNESVEEQLNNILERYHLLYWKQLGLQELIKNAVREKEHWEAIDNIRMTNDMTRIIEIAETLTETEVA